jgi:predicted phosphodiesterase
MRYAIISDLHANRQALKAVLVDIRSNGIDEIICLGDVIGYGPCPVETLELAYANIHHFIMGNHDAVVAGLIAPDKFNDRARELIDWTCSQLDKKASDFFYNNPLLLTGENFRCTHGEFENPGRFGYILDNRAAIKAFSACPEQLLFAGHSHMPGLFVVGSAAPHWLYPQDFGLEEGKRYIVNVGSVGQPRNGDIRASYCIYDDEKRDVLFRQIPFDIDGYRKDMNKQSLPVETSYFLAIADDMPQASLRDLIDFSQLKEEDRVKTDNEEIDLREQVTKLKASKRNLTIILIGLLITTIALVSMIFSGVFTKSVPNKKTFKVEALRTQISPSLQALIPGVELISMPENTGKFDEQNQQKNWSLELSDKKVQSVSIEEMETDKAEPFPVFRLKSSKLAPLLIKYLPIYAKKGMRFSASAQFKPVSIEGGFIEIMLIQKYENGTEKVLLKREPKNLALAKKWTHTSITISSKDAISKDGQIYYVVKGQFSGEILLRKCSMNRKE